MKLHSLFCTTTLLLFTNILLAQLQFEPRVVTSDQIVPEDLREIAFLDVDQDGFDDLVGVTYTGHQLWWFRNEEGSGNFSQGVVIDSFFGNFIALHLADFNDDGLEDLLLVVNHGISLFWYQNLGNGSFSNRIAVDDSMEEANTAVVLDLDGDQDLDIVFNDIQEDKLFWVENTDGAGAFGTRQVIQSSITVRHLDTADIDGDDDFDLVVLTFLPSDTLLWLENVDQQGDFSLPNIIYADNEFAMSFDLVDMDGDNDIDVVGPYLDKLAWYENDGSGGFQNLHPSDVAGAGFFEVKAYDWDHDNDMDVVYGDFEGYVGAFENTDGNGTLSAEIEMTQLTVIHHFAPGDFDNDTDTDLFIASKDEIGWFENTDLQAPFQQLRMVYKRLQGVHHVLAEDWNNDGVVSLVSGADDGNILFWPNDSGSGHFLNPRRVYLYNLDSFVLDSADLNGDNKKDLLVYVVNEPELFWIENTGGPQQFTTVHPINAAGIDLRQILHGDLDNDQDIDLIIRNNEEVFWMENMDGAGTYSSPESVHAADNNLLWMEFADLTGDSLPDLFLTVEETGYFWLENFAGTGTFGAEQLVSTDTPLYYKMSAVDIDNDLDLDIFYTGTETGWFENLDGLGQFSEVDIIHDFYFFQAAVFHDGDEDGDLDLFASSGSLHYFENLDGQGDFGENQNVFQIAGMKMDNLADIDSDGKLELAGLSTFHEMIFWLDEDLVLGIESQQDSRQIALYPNPSNDWVQVSSPEQIQELQLYDLNGRMLSTTPGDQPIRVQSLESGIYIIKAILANGSTLSSRLVVR